MATTYTSTIEVRCWKEHTCIGCEGTFAYLFTRKIAGKARSAEQATVAALRLAEKAKANEVDQQPCPTCGLYQPDMVGTRRASSHWLWFWIVLVTLAVLIVLYLADVVAPYVAVWIAAGVCAVAAVAHLLTDLKNPNSNLEANLQLARQRLEMGVLQSRTPGVSDELPDELRNPGWELAHKLTFALLFASVLCLPMCEIVRGASGWPLNKDWYPAVVGPGDEPYIYLPTKIHSVKSHWKGVPTVTATRADDPRLPPSVVKATSKTDSWGTSISVKSSEKDSTSTPWVKLNLDRSAELAGKTLNLEIDLEVTYPKIVRNAGAKDGWLEQEDALTHTASLQLAAPGAGRRYVEAWWLGMLGAGGFGLLMAVCLIGLANAAKRAALPNTVSAVE